MLGFGSLGEFPLGPADTDQNLDAVAASLSITGQDALLYASRLLTADVAAFTITGSDIEFRRGRLGLSVISGGGVRGLRASVGGGGRGLRIRA